MFGPNICGFERCEMVRRCGSERLRIGYWTIALCASILLLMTMFSDQRPAPPPPYQCQPTETFIPSDLEHNKAIIDSYRFPGATLSFVKDLGLNEHVTPVSRDVPVIATGCSDNHFPESLQMLENVKTKLFDSYKDLQIYYYDLGLTSAQRQQVRQLPRVHLRTFPFSKYPEHVMRLKGYAWKPIIIQSVLREFGFVMWMDASVRLIYSSIDRLTQQAKANGIAFRHGNSTLIPHTDIDTFKFLKENPCSFRDYTEIEANLIIIYRTQFINDYIMKPVVSCALTFGCLVTKNSAAIRTCPDVDQDHGCHRFDQAVFAIVFRRLFQNEEKYWIPRETGIYVCRGPEKFSNVLPESINQQIAKVKLFFNERNHARCGIGTKWYLPVPGIDD